MPMDRLATRAREEADKLEPWQRRFALVFIREHPDLAIRLHTFRHRQNGQGLTLMPRVAAYSLAIASAYALILAAIFGAPVTDPVIGAVAGAAAGAILTLGIELVRSGDELPGDAAELFGLLKGVASETGECRSVL